jgi:hypothetical protein
MPKPKPNAARIASDAERRRFVAALDDARSVLAHAVDGSRRP